MVAFGVAAPKQIWCEKTNKWQQSDQGTRPAHVYVFCLHRPVPATNANVADPTTWDFWVIPAQTLDDQLGAQKKVKPTTLKRLAKPIEWSQIKGGSGPLHRLAPNASPSGQAHVDRLWCAACGYRIGPCRQTRDHPMPPPLLRTADRKHRVLGGGWPRRTRLWLLREVLRRR